MLKEFKTNLKLKTFIAIFLTPILLLGFLVGTARAEWAGHLVISEILFDAEGTDTGKEFIELYNSTINDINLLGWSLKYTKDELPEVETLAVFSKEESNTPIFKNRFFLIGFNKYAASNYNNIIADVTRGASLPNGEKDKEAQKITIILSDKDGKEIDRIIYDKNSITTDGQSLERKAYQNNNCVSAQNAGENLGNSCDTGNLDDFEVRLVPNPQNSQSAAEPAAGNSQAPALTPTPTPTPSSSPAASLPVAEAGQDKEAVIGENIDFDGSDSFDPQGKELVLTWDFGDKTSAKGINVSHSYNEIGEYRVILKADNGENISEDSLKIKIIAPEFSDKIILSEILPNPIGADKDGEWVELFNFGDKKVNLRGWILRSAAKTSGKQYVFSGDNFIEAKSFLVVKRSESGLVLTNESGGASLSWLADKILSEVSYGAAKEGKSYAYINNIWQWADAPTPGKENSTKVLTAVSNKKGNSALPFDIAENMNGEKVYYDESEMTGDDLIMQSLATNAIFQSIKKTSIEDYLNKLISEKVDSAILKAKANEAAPQEKISSFADSAEGVGIMDTNKESACEDFCLESEKNTSGDQKDVRNNPWFYGNIALSALSLFLVWRYQEARKKLKQL
ncbi:lamin tail domain-containing protein [Patescibacteria group bacterium]|nr:lamin tail domain-containing protein [Patescibacteria group bacterium]